MSNNTLSIDLSTHQPKSTVNSPSSLSSNVLSVDLAASKTSTCKNIENGDVTNNPCTTSDSTHNNIL